MCMHTVCAQERVGVTLSTGCLPIRWKFVSLQFCTSALCVQTCWALQHAAKQ